MFQVSWEFDESLGYRLILDADGCQSNMDIRLFSYAGENQWALRCGGLFYEFEADDVDIAKKIAEKKVLDWTYKMVGAMERHAYIIRKEESPWLFQKAEEEPQKKIEFRKYL